MVTLPFKSLDMPHINVDDCSLYYHIHGKGQPVLLIAGYLCDHVFWRSVSNRLSQHYQVIVLDNRGVGQSSLGRGIQSTQQLAQDTLALLRALRIERPIVVGHSMGGMIAHHMALLAPEVIQHLVLYCSRPCVTAQSAFYMKTFLELSQSSNDPVMNTRLTLPWVMSESFFENPKRVEQLLELASQNLYPIKPAVQQQQYQAVLQHDLRDRLADISVPTTLIAGDADLLVPAALSRHMAKQIPMARYHLIEGAAHSWNLEQPEAFIQTLLPILAEVVQ